MNELEFRQLRLKNILRNSEVFSPCNNWTLMEWGCAMAGEAGELCNILKKIKRMGENTNTAKDPQSIQEAKTMAGKEMADIIIYLDLIAEKMGVDLGQAVQDKFNEVSERMEATIFI